LVEQHAIVRHALHHRRCCSRQGSSVYTIDLLRGGDLRRVSGPLPLFITSSIRILKFRMALKVVGAPRRLDHANGVPSTLGNTCLMDQYVSRIMAARHGKSPSRIEQSLMASKACCARASVSWSAMLGASVEWRIHNSIQQASRTPRKTQNGPYVIKLVRFSRLRECWMRERAVTKALEVVRRESESGEEEGGVQK
jgi:hypothetical protein